MADHAQVPVLALPPQTETETETETGLTPPFSYGPLSGGGGQEAETEAPAEELPETAAEAETEPEAESAPGPETTPEPEPEPAIELPASHEASEESLEFLDSLPFQETLRPLAESTFMGNSLLQWSAAGIALALVYLIGLIAKLFFWNLGKKFDAKDRNVLREAVIAVRKSVAFISIAFGISLALGFISIGGQLGGMIQTIAGVLVTLSIGMLIYRLVEVPVQFVRDMFASDDNKFLKLAVPLVSKTLHFVVIVLIAIQVASQVSQQEITSIIAALGVGGLAVALAAQDTVKNFFGSLVLIADRPFEMGDRVVVNGHDGPVESVGMRSTKIRTLDGHLVTVPNGELANLTIQNIGKRPHIRRLMTVGVTYDTPPEKVQRGMEIIKDLLKDHEGMDEEFPPRVYFEGFGDWSMNIMVIYWYHPPAYWDYMAFSEWFNLELLRRFNEEGIEFAFPSQTLYHETGGDENQDDSATAREAAFAQMARTGSAQKPPKET